MMSLTAGNCRRRIFMDDMNIQYRMKELKRKKDYKCRIFQEVEGRRKKSCRIDWMSHLLYVRREGWDGWVRIDATTKGKWQERVPNTSALVPDTESSFIPIRTRFRL